MLGRYLDHFNYERFMEEFIKQLFVSFSKHEDEFFVGTDTWYILSKDVSLSLSGTLNYFATCLANMYYRGDLNYEFCDALVNIAWSDILSEFGGEKTDAWPSDFYEVYEAFDAGEFHRKEDKSDDPEIDHTVPLIREFLERINSKT
jgi:hypothetical protein